MHATVRTRPFATLLFLLGLVACGGGGDDAAAPAAAGTVIGVAGGTVNGPNGARLVIPGGALSSDVTIAIEQSVVGAPALPGRMAAIGSTFALTPHGTKFNIPVTLTLPFDPRIVPTGSAPVLLKSNAAAQWEQISSATFGTDTLTAQISSFSYAVATVPPLTRSEPKREWEFHTTTDFGDRTLSSLSGEQTGGELLMTFLFGATDPNFELDNGETPGLAIGEIFSSPSGESYSAYAEAPRGDPSIAGFRSGGESRLRQSQSFVKRAPDAKLQIILTTGFLAASDFNGRPEPAECHNDPVEGKSDEEIARFCIPLFAELDFKVDAFRGPLGPGRYEHLFLVHGDAELMGFSGKWKFFARTLADSLVPLWNETNFTVTGMDGLTPRAALNGPLVIDIDLSSIEVCPPELDAIFCADKAFTLFSFVRVLSWNWRGRESGAAAYLRDPLKLQGTAWMVTGLEPTNNPAPPPPDGVTASVACPSGSDPAAGALQFGAASYTAVEGALSPRDIVITRTGGSKGAVSVNVGTRIGTALAGVDYDPLASTIHFADGDTAPRGLTLKLLPNSLAEPDKTLGLDLSDPGGCATLGTRSTATLTILDDDRPPPVLPTYTVGGSISGLVGTGLALRDAAAGVNLTAGNGPFTFPVPRSSGLAYDVRVETQPTNPIQLCTVANGSGTFTNDNVTNVSVTCTLPAPNGALDPTFGSGGKVATSVAFTSGTGTAPVAMALQKDGRILLAGGQKLLRVNNDGTLDMSFGTAGVATVPFNGSSADAAQGIVVQPDGRIVVVGFMLVAGQDDFALARFNADGTLDASFGSGGRVTTDFAGSTDRARRVVIQADGKLVVAGFSTVVPTPTTAFTSFAVARYNTDGSLDTGFGGGGKSGGGFVGTIDWAQGLALQPDGKVVLVGRTGADGGSDPDIGTMRFIGTDNYFDANGLYFPPGAADKSFGAMGTGGASSDLSFNGWEEGVDVVAPSADTLLVTCLVNAGGSFRFALVKLVTYNGIGGLLGGVTLTDFSTQNDYPKAMALQPDGKAIVVGQSAASSANPDFAIARYAAGGLGLDTAFGSAGKVTVDFFGAIDSAQAVALQPDGKIVVGGFARNAGKTVFALLRLIP